VNGKASVRRTRSDAMAPRELGAHAVMPQPVTMMPISGRSSHGAVPSDSYRPPTSGATMLS